MKLNDEKKLKEAAGSESDTSAETPKKRSTRAKKEKVAVSSVTARPIVPVKAKPSVATREKKPSSTAPKPVTPQKSTPVSAHKPDVKVAVEKAVKVSQAVELPPSDLKPRTTAKKEEKKVVEHKKEVPVVQEKKPAMPHELPKDSVVSNAAPSYDREKESDQPRGDQQQVHSRNYQGQQSRSNQGPQSRPHHSQQSRPHQNQPRGQYQNSSVNRNQPRPQAQSAWSNQNQAAPSQDYKNIPLEELSLTDLIARSRRYGIIGASLMKKEKLIEAIKYAHENPEREVPVEGVLEKLPDGFGFLRSPNYDYISGPDDVYVSPSQIRRFHLRTGDTVTGIIRNPREGEKYFALLKVDQVNFSDPATTSDRAQFDQLTPLHPNEKFNLEFDPAAISTRVLDIFTPIGKGQRGLIVAPPKVGKTLLLKELTKSFIANHPEVRLIVLLVDERPEEVADIKRTVRGTSAEVISSTFDESAERHVQVAERVLEKAKRLVESGKDVVILLDSITRLARAYNTVAPSSGKVLTGGIDANALHYPKRFFGAARTTEEAGSLTIIASALVDTGSRMDEVIFEEFKGTGNMEVHMSRKLAHRRIYPAFDLMVSGTRRDDLLHAPEDLNKVWVLQKFLSTMSTAEGMEFMIDKMKKFKTNKEFLDSMNK